MIVNDYLDKHFEEILDYNFTANVEKEFDEIAEGGKEWTNMIREFYTAFHPTVEKALEELPDRSGRERILGTDPKKRQTGFGTHRPLRSHRTDRGARTTRRNRAMPA